MTVESKGKPVRTPLTDAAVVAHGELCEATALDDECLIVCKGNAIRGFGMQDVVPWHEWDTEVTLCIRLDLCDLYATRAFDRQCGLILSVGTCLPLLHNGTRWSNEHLPFDSTAPRRGAVEGASCQDQDQYTNKKLHVHGGSPSLLFSINSWRTEFVPRRNDVIPSGLQSFYPLGNRFIFLESCHLSIPKGWQFSSVGIIFFNPEGVI